MTRDVQEQPASVVCADGSMWPPPPGTPRDRWPRPEYIPVPLVCAICGVSTPLAMAKHDEVDRGWRLQYPPARICLGCQPAMSLKDGGPLRTLIGLVDPADPAAPKVLEAVAYYSDLVGSSPWAAGASERWAHVDRVEVAAVIAAVHARLEPRRSPSRHGCAGCGVAESPTWAGNVQVRSGGWMQLCADCYALTEHYAIGDAWMDTLAAAAGGLTRRPVEGYAAEIGFQPYIVTDPRGAGTGKRFAYLGEDLAGLREYAARHWPEYLPGAVWSEAIASKQQRHVPPTTVRPGLRLDA